MKTSGKKVLIVSDIGGGGERKGKKKNKRKELGGKEKR